MFDYEDVDPRALVAELNHIFDGRVCVAGLQGLHWSYINGQCLAEYLKWRLN